MDPLVHMHLVGKAEEFGLSPREAHEYADIVKKAQTENLSLFERLLFFIYKQIMRQARSEKERPIVIKISSHPKYNA